MAMPEIDSFVWKFKKLLHFGMNATLEMKSEAGKAVLKLTAEVDVLPQPHIQSRNPPSRQRRREKRAAEREAAASAVAAATVGDQGNLVVEETAEETETVTKDTIAEKAPVVKESKSEAGKAKVAENRTDKPISEEVIDEVCPNEEYSGAKSISTSSQSAAPTSTSTSRKPFFDYNTLLTYDDMSDPD